MAMDKVVKILIARDGLTEQEAKELIGECQDALLRGEEYAIEDYLGLEDDYIFDVMGW